MAHYIGNNQPVELRTFVEALGELPHRRAEKNLLPMQPGDVPATDADISKIPAAVGFEPRTPLREELRHCVDWYHEFYQR